MAGAAAQENSESDRTVLDTYGDSDMALSAVMQSSHAKFDEFCTKIIGHLKVNTSASLQVALRNFHQLSQKMLPSLWKDLFRDLELPLVKTVLIQSVNRSILNALLLKSKNCSTVTTEREDCTYFQRIFWQQQVLAASKKDARGMRWHPLMIKWCIYLRAQSQGAYETLHQSKCIRMPSQRTLRDYTHHLKSEPGFSAGVDAQLLSATNINSCEERDKHVLLLLDEMYVKQDLVYDKNTGELIGFMNLGDINNHLLALEQSMSLPDESTEVLARTMMVFMVKGLFSRLEFPYAHFPCHKLTGELIFDPFWDAVYRLERLGLKVCLLVCRINNCFYLMVAGPKFSVQIDCLRPLQIVV